MLKQKYSLALAGLVLMGLMTASFTRAQTTASTPSTENNFGVNAATKATATPKPKTKATPKPDADVELVSTLSQEKLANGWTRYAHKEAGFAISLPVGWRALDLEKDDFEALLAQAVKGNADLSKLLTTQAQQYVASGVKLLGINSSSSKTGNVDTVNVLVQKIPGDSSALPMKTFIKLLGTQVESTFKTTKGIKTSTVKMKVGEVGKLEYTIDVKQPNGKTVAVPLTQYVVLKGNKLFVATFGNTGIAKKSAGTTPYDKMMQTFEVLE